MKSSECKILSFKLGSYEGTIDEQNHSVTIKIPYGKDISSLTPAVTVSDHATCVRTGDSTGWEFGTPVTYQVTAEDGTSQLYTVTAVQADVTESCEMTSFKIGNSEGVIDQAAGTVTVTVPADTNLSIVTPVIGIPEGAKVSPASGERVDLTNPVTYTVTRYFRRYENLYGNGYESICRHRYRASGKMSEHGGQDCCQIPYHCQ